MQIDTPFWLPGGHTQTLWAARLARPHHPPHAPSLVTERWTTPDQDFIDVVRVTPAQPSKPLLVLFHGLEGSVHSHYARAFAHACQQQQWGFALPHFRGCSGEINLAPRAYHSGDFAEIAWILARFRQQHSGPLYAVGVSLGGNALLRWAEEMGTQAQSVVHGAVAISAPLDLCASGQALSKGFNLQVYTRLFLNTMKPKAKAKWHQFPGLFDLDRVMRARNLYEFDDAFTAPLHGFRDTPDYWSRASAKPLLSEIRLPTLILNARNDPFVPAQSLPPAADHTQTHALSSWVQLLQPKGGGHVGFAQGRFPGHLQGLPRLTMSWLQAHQAHG
jgi:predicted alpha/beta-fold hydrolase